ncbi:MAG: alpha/beta hydrolase [Chitinophagaceae bacterium]|nr:alpha/beta hydrolase [Chitinophagaceae bacterium]
MKKRLRYHFLFIPVIFFICCCYKQAAAQQKTYVIVHGAWGGSWSFKKVASILNAKGNIVYRPSLTGQGERVHLASPDIDLNTHILDVINTILFEDLHDLILVGHSYGGEVITGVADSIPGRIKQLIYLDAILPDDGESVITSRTDGKRGPEHESVNGFVIPNWINPADPLPHDVPQSLKTFTTPVKWKNPLALALPATYIFTADDVKHPENDHFYFFANRAKQRGWKVVTMAADHNPQMTKPGELADILEKQSAR